MKCFRKAAGVVTMLAVMSVFGGISRADYRFDDLGGPSGKSYQWMILNEAGDTFGDDHSVAVDVSGDVITADEAVLNVINGTSESPVNDRSLHTFFIVIADGHGEFDLNFNSPYMDYDAATPNPRLSTPFNENDTPYYDTVTPTGRPAGYGPTWRRFHFDIDRENRYTGRYDTIGQYLYFQQNPRNLSSQGVLRPMIISNVSTGNAQDEPLVLRMTLRDQRNNGNIVAYDYDTWDMTQEKTVGGNQWVFVPVESLPVDNVRRDYYLTTEVVNKTSYRYAAHPYDSYGSQEAPDYWKFDIARYQGTTNITSRLLLAPSSQIAPGLVSVFQREYNVNENSKRPLRLHPVDDIMGTGGYDLRLNHRILFGRRLGGYQLPASGNNKYNLIDITAFELRPASNTFYDRVASITNAPGTVRMNTNSTGSAMANRNLDMPSEVVQYFTIDQTIPGPLRNSAAEGILPLHITFNLPVTLMERTWWDNMLNTWRNNDGRIEDTFAENFELYLMAGENNIWNLSQELMDKGVYNDQIKVFFDEERGAQTRDNDRGVVTVSFIAMLMNGTRDGERPELSIVSDDSITQTKDYVVIRDGTYDNKWNMTFFIAPAGYFTNPNVPDRGRPRNNNDSGGSSGGCEALAGVSMLYVPCVMLYRRKKSKAR